MKAVIDLRSFVVGAVLSALVILALGASLGESPRVGRFQVETTTSNVFVLDTATGQVWGKYVSPRRDIKDEEFMSARLFPDRQ